MPRRSWLAWVLWALVLAGLAGVVWFDVLLRQAGRPELGLLGVDDAPYLLSVLSATTVGAVLASRRPDHPVGWLLLALGLGVVVSGLTGGYAGYGLLARPGSLPAAELAALYDDASWIPWAVCVTFIMLLTPTGSLPSPRWRWWAWLVAGAAVVAALLRPGTLDEPFESVHNPLAVNGPLIVLSVAAAILLNLAVLVAAVSLVVRFLRASGVERQQLRWVALAAGLPVLAVLVILAAWALGWQALIGWATAGYVAILPIAIGASILRYRLYDLDRIINRAVVYGVVTVLLGSGYTAAVLALGQVLGSDDSLVVAGATLVVAALFQPARRRVQQAVDRRFDRRRYDAAATIHGFSTRLRQQIDLDALTAELLAVVDRTMQPTRTSLWLRPPP